MSLDRKKGGSHQHQQHQQQGRKVGPTHWVEDSMSLIKESQQAIKKSEKHFNSSKSTDPVPGLRSALTDLSNNAASQYMRTTRYVVYLLRDVLIDVNEQVKAMLRCREKLEKVRDKLDQDIVKNNRAQNIRNQRPARERIEDDADGLLKLEMRQLVDGRKNIEAGCDALKNHLNSLEQSRRKLQTAIQDRSKVLGLAADAVPIGSRQVGKLPEEIISPDENGPYTPEVHNSVLVARDLVEQSGKMRESFEAKMKGIEDDSRAITERVNGVLSKKITETRQLKGRLSIALDDTKLAANKAQKNFDETHHSWLDLQGAEDGKNTEIAEKQNRPLISTYQQHPGTHLTEAENIHKGRTELLQSLRETGGHVAMLKMSEAKLADNIADKKMAISVDKQAANVRRRKHIE